MGDSFDKRSSERIKRAVRKGEAWENRPIASSPSNLSDGSFVAKIVAIGPNSESDFTTPMYWVKSVELTNSDINPASAHALTEIDSNSPAFRHVPAYNLKEHIDQSHTLSEGDIVHVFPIRSSSSKTIQRYYFYAGQGEEVVTYIGGHFSGAGSISAFGCAFGANGRWYARNTSETEQLTVICYDLALYDGELYGVGQFKLDNGLGGYDTILFAKWDTEVNEWVDVANGIDDLDITEAYCLHVYNGNLLIGGTGSPTGVRQFNGSSYSDMGSGGDQHLGAVQCFYEWQDTLYVGGSGYNSSGEARGVAYWTGSSWAELNSGIADGVVVYALASHDDGNGDALYIGGDFVVSISGLTATKVIAFDGSGWKHLFPRSGFSGMINQTGEVVYALASYSGRLYIGGIKLSPGDGAIAVYDSGKIQASASSLIHHSDVSPTYRDIFVRSLKVYTDPSDNQEKLLVGGQFFHSQESQISEEAERICRLDSVYEAVTVNGFDDRVTRIIEFDSDVYTVGRFENSGTTEVNYFAVLNGSSWGQAGEVDDWVNDADIASVNGSDALVLGGRFTGKCAYYDGNDVTPFCDIDGNVTRILTDVSSPANFYVAGDFTEVDSTTSKGVCKLNLTSSTLTHTVLCTVFTKTNGTAVINDFSLDANYLYVCGLFNSIGNANGTVSVQNVARYHIASDTWSAMGSSTFTNASGTTSGEGKSIQAFDNYVWYSFDRAPFVRRWDKSLGTWGFITGPTYSTAMSGVSQMIRAVDTTLYIHWESESEVKRHRIVTWDTTNGYEILGAGDPALEDIGIFDRSVFTVCETDSGDGTQLHFGGDFLQTGNKEDDRVFPRNCLCQMTKSESFKAYLGGASERSIGQAFPTGGAVFYVRSVKILALPEFNTNVVCIAGDFYLVSNVACVGIIGYSNRRGFFALGDGVDWGTRNLAGVVEILKTSWGTHIFVGNIATAFNPPNASQSIVTCNGIVEWDGEEYWSLIDPYSNVPVAPCHSVAELDGHLWVVHDGEEAIAEYDPEEASWDLRGANLDWEGDTSIKKIIVFDGELYACGHITFTGGGTSTVIRHTGGGEWEDISPPDIMFAEDMVTVPDFDSNGIGLIVCGSVELLTDTGVYRLNDAGSWSAVGPSYPADGSNIGVVTEVGYVDFSSTNPEIRGVITAMGGNVRVSGNTVECELAYWNSNTNEWIPTGHYGLNSTFTYTDSVFDNRICLAGGDRIVIETENPDVGNVILDYIGQYDPVNGWRRVNGAYGLNDRGRCFGD